MLLHTCTCVASCFAQLDPRLLAPPSGSSSGPGAPSFAREGLASHAEADSSGGGGGAGSASSAVAGAASGSGAAASLSAEAAAEEVAEEDALATALLLSRLER